MKFSTGAVGALIIASLAQNVLSFTPPSPRVDCISTNPLLAPNLSYSSRTASRSQATNTLLQLSGQERAHKKYFAGFPLRMAAEDFNESKYTEAAWSLISSITQVADFYQASNVEAPLLLDLMLNPSKHNAGENVEAAKKVVEKALTKAGVNVSELRSGLETHLSQQARISNSSSSKTMGRSLQKVLETARISQSILGVSTKFKSFTFLIMTPP
jgi:hypothetical protein